MDNNNILETSIFIGMKRGLTLRDQVRYELGAVKNVLLYASSVELLSLNSDALQPVFSITDLSSANKVRLLKKVATIESISKEFPDISRAVSTHHLLLSKKVLKGLSKEEEKELADLEGYAHHLLEGVQDDMLSRLGRYEPAKYSHFYGRSDTNPVKPSGDQVGHIYELINSYFTGESSKNKSNSQYLFKHYVESIIDIVSSSRMLCIDKYAWEGLGSIIINPRLFTNDVLENLQFLILPTPDIEFSLDEVEDIRTTAMPHIEKMRSLLTSLSTSVSKVTNLGTEVEAEQMAEIITDFMLQAIFSSKEIEEIWRAEKLICDSPSRQKNRKDGGASNATLGISYGWFHSHVTPEIVSDMLGADIAQSILKSEVYINWQNNADTLDYTRVALYYSTQQMPAKGKRKKRG